MTKGTNVCCYAVFPTKIFIEYVGANMGIQVPLLVIDRRRVSVMSTLFSNRRVRTLKVSMRLYYEFMYFDVPKLVRSPGCDHGHDEESRNGRDVKIDILDDYIRTSEWFRVVSDKTGVPEGLPEPPGEVMGLIGPEGRERAAARRWRPPPMGSPNWTRRGARPRFPSPSPSFSFPP